MIVWFFALMGEGGFLDRLVNRARQICGLV